MALVEVGVKVRLQIRQTRGLKVCGIGQGVRDVADSVL